MTSPNESAGAPGSQIERAVDELLALLDLTRLDADRFRGRNESNRFGRLFGGQVVAQALMAAARTADERLPHSLHAYFLKPGDCEIPVDYEVHRVRDGRSFGTRRVLALQDGEAIFNLSASFHVEEPGPEAQRARRPDAPPPETLPTLQ